VPGDRPDRFDKAVAASPDVVVMDLEDAVAPDRKDYARDAVVDFLAAPRSGSSRLQVRINSRETTWWRADLDAIGAAAGLGGVRIPKVESAADIEAVGQRVAEVGLHALVETARGVEALGQIADAATGSVGLGEADLASDLGIGDDGVLDWIRSRLVVAARAAGLPPPMMSVFTALDDEDGLAKSCRVGRRRGFIGRSAIHPRQLPVIRAAFTPAPAEVDEARAVLAALAEATQRGAGIAVLGGRMVDAAMRDGAERTLALAALLGADG
jgi:citrate lyase subunit beta/citryl-CoA lyase